jgi:hypothetical protein
MVHQKTLFCSLAIGFVSANAVMLSSHAQAQPTASVHQRWYMLACFAEPLCAAEERYRIARHSDVVRGKFEAQTFKPEPVMEARMNEINRKSFSLWGTLKNHSKHAQG